VFIQISDVAYVCLQCYKHIFILVLTHKQNATTIMGIATKKLLECCKGFCDVLQKISSYVAIVFSYIFS
jgi:hypothetical protein